MLEATLYSVSPAMKCTRLVSNHPVPHVVRIDMPVLFSAVSAVIKHAMTTMRYLRARGQLNGCCG